VGAVRAVGQPEGKVLFRSPAPRYQLATMERARSRPQHPVEIVDPLGVRAVQGAVDQVVGLRPDPKAEGREGGGNEQRGASTGDPPRKLFHLAEGGAADEPL